MSSDPIVYLIDPDVDSRAIVEQKLAEIKLDFRAFGDTESFLADIVQTRLGCVLTELKIGGSTAFQLAKQLRQRKAFHPVVLITSYATVPLTVQAFKAGLFEVLEKPGDTFQLLDCVTRAFESHGRVLEEDHRANVIHGRFAKLSPQELQVMQMVLDGQPNKRIAARLGISPRTIVFRRKSLMQKLNARTVADLAFLTHLVTIGNDQGSGSFKVPQLDISSVFSVSEAGGE